MFKNRNNIINKLGGVYLPPVKKVSWQNLVLALTAEFKGMVKLCTAGENNGSASLAANAKNRVVTGICDERFPDENRVLLVKKKFAKKNIEILKEVAGIIFVEDDSVTLEYIQNSNIDNAVMSSSSAFAKICIWLLSYFNKPAHSESFFLNMQQHGSLEQYKKNTQQFLFNVKNGGTVSNFSVGLNVLCGKNVSIGKGALLMGNNFIGDYCIIEEQVILHPGVVLCEGTYIGRGSVVHAGTVIGGDGFGYELLEEQGQQILKKIPQLGRVIIGDDVEIGGNVAVDKAAISATIIGNDVKIDNLVQIAHNVEIGDGSIIVSQVGIAGSSKIGSGVTLAGQVGIADHCYIGNGVKIGAQSGVASGKKVPDGSVLFGSPAIDFRLRMRMESKLRALTSKGATSSSS